MIARMLIYIKRIQCLNVLSCELPLSYMYVCLFVCQTRALLQNRFDICSLYMRSSSATSAETSAAGVRTDDISVMCRLRTRSACAARRISAVQTIVSDFEAALWLAVRDVFPGIAQRGFPFPFLTGRVEERPVGRPAVGVCQRRQHQPRLPQDTGTGAVFPAGRCHWR